MKKAPKTLAASVFADTKEKDSDALGADQVLYRFLVDSLTEYAVFAVSPTGIVISWNASAEKTFGYWGLGRSGTEKAFKPRCLSDRAGTATRLW